MKKPLLAILLMSCFFIVAQDKAPTLPRVSVRANVGIPKVTSSEALRNSFSGIMSSDASFNYRLFSNFFVGLGYEYTYYKTQKYFRDKNINTTMQAHAGYIKLGYDHFFSETGFATFALNTGFGRNNYTRIVYKSDSLINKYPREFSNTFVEPVIGLYFLVEPNFAIGGHLSYNYSFSKFDPRYPGMDKWFDYEKVSNKNTIGMITFGFGFYYGFNGK